MERLRLTLVAAGVLATWGALQSLLAAGELAAAPPTTRLRLPLTGLAGVIGFGLNVATYGALGRAIALGGGSSGAAAGSGAVSGALAAVASAAFNLILFREQVALLLASYGVSPATSDGLLAAGLVLGALLSAGLGAGAAWLAALLFRPKGEAA